MMKSLLAPALALALVGCAAQSPQATVQVRGAPVEVATFVTAERARDGEVDVAYQNGEDSAVFVARTSDEHYQISRRAIEARLSVEAKSNS